MGTIRPSFAAANRVVTLTRVTNERVVGSTCCRTGQVRSGQVTCCEQTITELISCSPKVYVAHVGCEIRRIHMII